MPAVSERVTSAHDDAIVPAPVPEGRVGRMCLPTVRLDHEAELLELEVAVLAARRDVLGVVQPAGRQTVGTLDVPQPAQFQGRSNPVFDVAQQVVEEIAPSLPRSLAQLSADPVGSGESPLYDPDDQVRHGFRGVDPFAGDQRGVLDPQPWWRRDRVQTVGDAACPDHAEGHDAGDLALGGDDDVEDGRRGVDGSGEPEAGPWPGRRSLPGAEDRGPEQGPRRDRSAERRVHAGVHRLPSPGGEA